MLSCRKPQLWSIPLQSTVCSIDRESFDRVGDSRPPFEVGPFQKKRALSKPAGEDGVLGDKSDKRWERAEFFRP